MKAFVLGEVTQGHRLKRCERVEGIKLVMPPPGAVALWEEADGVPSSRSCQPTQEAALLHASPAGSLVPMVAGF